MERESGETPGIAALAGGDGSDARGIALLEGRGPLEGPVAYVCVPFARLQPVADPAQLGAVLGVPPA